MTNIYIELTRQFNSGKTRAILSSGQAVVMHRLAVMSKDGDWILREDKETMAHVLEVLSGYEAVYRFCAPLDVRWLSGGWSSHLEFQHGPLRVRTDFVTRPPRISSASLKKVWEEQEKADPPFVDIKTLIEIKKTNREKDYAVIGELSRLMQNPEDQLFTSRSARDLIQIANRHPQLVSRLFKARPALEQIAEGQQKLEEALDAERRSLMHANERRLEAYATAAKDWLAAWPSVQKEIAGHALAESHAMIVRRAEGVLPFEVPYE